MRGIKNGKRKYKIAIRNPENLPFISKYLNNRYNEDKMLSNSNHKYKGSTFSLNNSFDTKRMSPDQLKFSDKFQKLPNTQVGNKTVINAYTDVKRRKFL